MTSEVSVEEIKRDIAALYDHIERCNRSKNDLLLAIQKEKETANELQFYIGENSLRLKRKQKLVYDNDSLSQNIARCNKNIELFEDTSKREDEAIARYRYMIDTLTADLERPKEILFDAKTGKVISISGGTPE